MNGSNSLRKSFKSLSKKIVVGEERPTVEAAFKKYINFLFKICFLF